MDDIKPKSDVISSEWRFYEACIWVNI